MSTPAQPSQPSPAPSTQEAEYADRLVGLQTVWWKRLLPVQAPYRWNLRRLDLGFVLDVGCGIGRNLTNLDGRGVGVDHNADAVATVRAMGMRAHTSDEFASSSDAKLGGFDSLLLAHVAEHMHEHEVVALVQEYRPYVRGGGKLVLITPQERGYRSDATHVEFMDLDRLASIAAACGATVEKRYSFPFPRRAGTLFVYNEFVLVATFPTSTAGPTPGAS